MTDFTRLTIVGTLRRATIVVPSDESVGALIPRLMELLGEQVASVARPLTLVRLTGEQLDPTLSAAEQTVADGEILRLLRLDEAPPPPEVSDVTDAVSESLASRAGLWSAEHRTMLGAGGAGALILVASLQALQVPGLAVIPVALWAVSSLAGMGLGLARRRSVARVLLGVALGTTLPVALWLLWPVLGALLASPSSGASVTGDTFVTTKEQLIEWTWPVAVATTLLLAWISLLLVAGLGRRDRPAILGAGVGVAGSILSLALVSGFIAAGRPVAEAAAIVAVVAVVGVGLVPWYAMSASGLTGLDDQVMTGRLADREGVLTTVGGAYRTLTWTTFAVAGALSAALFGVALTGDPWILGLGAVVAVIGALRTRAFPLAAQAWPLWLGVLLPLLYGVVSRFAGEPALAAASLAGVAVVVVALVVAEPAAHQRASFRRFGNILETVSVIALIPLLLGSFGVFGELLGSFSS
ncbi:EsaB/YukD family protein [Frondihabitans peucedani]|uniref:EccD-like transmembrane domain-containing protein n=1 Tax=Frondihabitans peucedani TaxID=598626 RepID=A0ABP8DWS4_9MICO